MLIVYVLSGVVGFLVGFVLGWWMRGNDTCACVEESDLSTEEDALIAQATQVVQDFTREQRS